MRSGLKVGDAMTTKPITTEPGTTIQECAGLMKEFDIGSVLIQETDQVLGIVTEYDLTRKILAEGKEYDTEVAAIMEDVLITITPDKDLTDAMKLMRDNEIRHLPVVEDDIFTGLITMKDILRIEPELFELVVEKIRLREEYRKPIGERVGEEGICESCGNYAEVLHDMESSKVCKECR